MESKKVFLYVIFLFSFLTFNCYSQQYGWADISNHLPSSNGTASLSDMHWINESEGWICSGALGEIYHTTDGGQTFETQTTQYYTNAIYMINSQLGYAGGIQGIVYKTTNGGADWIIHGSIGSTLLDIDFPPNSDSGYCCGDNGNIYKINSAQINAVNSGVTYSLRSISFPLPEFGWTCGGSIILHFDGSTWDEQDSPLGSSYNGIYMINSYTGFAVGASGNITSTSNGGIPWTKQTSPTTNSLNDIFFLNINEGWTVGNSGVILNTTNGGVDWNIILDGWTTNMLRSVQFTSSTKGYILGNNKTLFKYGLLTDVEQHPTQPTEFKLEQNYPNPFNPSTKIKYTIPQNPPSSPFTKGGSGDSRGGFVILKVFDVLGNEIATLVNEEKAPGTYEVEFQSTFGSHQLASQIYFYQLRAGDPSAGSGQVYVQTKKMILLK